MYPKAVEAGIDADKYWSMTYEEIIVQAEANARIKERELKEQAMLDYKAAQLQAYAFNDPKKMPKFDDHYSFSQETDDQAQDSSKQNQQQDWRLMKERMMSYTEAIKRTREKKNESEKGG